MSKLSDRKIEDQSRDTGMAVVLLLLLVYIALKKPQAMLYAAIAVHVVNMTAPQIFRPVSVVWLWFSELLGAAVSKIVMGIVFFGVVTPMGLWRRMTGKDSLKLRAFKAGAESVMCERNHMFIAKDLETPY